VVRKFFLHVSKKEQRKRFLKRLEEKDKNWKFAASDVRERQHWGAYMRAYEDMIRHTATAHAPWYVIPADNKWFTRIAVAEAITQALGDLNLSFPKVGAVQRKQLASARAGLEAESAGSAP
jgi:polyphosphate kinase 2 (PPK2 family)